MRNPPGPFRRKAAAPKSVTASFPLAAPRHPPTDGAGKTARGRPPAPPHRQHPAEPSQDPGRPPAPRTSPNRAHCRQAPDNRKTKNGPPATGSPFFDAARGRPYALRSEILRPGLRHLKPAKDTGPNAPEESRTRGAGRPGKSRAGTARCALFRVGHRPGLADHGDLHLTRVCHFVLNLLGYVVR